GDCDPGRLDSRCRPRSGGAGGYPGGSGGDREGTPPVSYRGRDPPADRRGALGGAAASGPLRRRSARADGDAGADPEARRAAPPIVRPGERQSPAGAVPVDQGEGERRCEVGFPAPPRLADELQPRQEPDLHPPVRLELLPPDAIEDVGV